MSFRPDLQALALGVLSEGPAHGYAIARRIEAAGPGTLKAGEGLLYPALHALEAAGYVTARWEPQPGKPDRKVYELTDEGKRELARQRERWRIFRASVDAALAPS